MATANFELDTNNVLGFGYEQYVGNIRALALSDPKAYFKLRNEVMKQVRTDAVGNLYKTFFAVLHQGQKLGGGNIGILGLGDYIPNYPQQKINDLALSAANDMSGWIDKVVDILLPDDFEKLASAKLNLKGKSLTIA